MTLSSKNLDKTDNSNKIQNLLNDVTKFEQNSLKNDRFLSVAINQEKWVVTMPDITRLS